MRREAPRYCDTEEAAKQHTGFDRYLDEDVSLRVSAGRSTCSGLMRSLTAIQVIARIPKPETVRALAPIQRRKKPKRVSTPLPPRPAPRRVSLVLVSWVVPDGIGSDRAGSNKGLGPSEIAATRECHRKVQQYLRVFGQTRDCPDLGRLARLVQSRSVRDTVSARTATITAGSE
jgi:hypothetical protein